MKSVNLICVSGNLTKDPELRTTPNGKSVATLRIAINSNHKDKEGREKKATFINIVVWDQNAINCTKYLTKGRGIIVDGRIESREFINRENTKNNIVEIVASNVIFLPRKENNASVVENVESQPEESLDMEQ